MTKRKRRESVTHKIMSRVIEIQNEKTPHDLSRKNYIRNTKRFISFCRERYDCRDFDSCREHIQDYSDYLKGQEYTPSTISTYIASVCSTFNISMGTICGRPHRKAGEFTRGRQNILNHTNQDFNDPSYKRLVVFQMIAGLRRNELKNLTGDCLVKDSDNFWCLYVRNGKGGKSQLQRLVRPEDIDIIKPYFEGKMPDEPIFMQQELNNDLNLHKLRALSAQAYYEYQLNRIMTEPGYEEELIRQIRKRWEETNIDKRTGKPRPFNEKNLKSWYVTRGSVRKAAIKNGRPIKYRRSAALACSVFRLSHYRVSVSIANYLIL